MCVCLCVCTKPPGRICLVRGKIKRTHQGLPWCNTGQNPESVTPACRLNWPLNPFYNFLYLPLSSSVVFSHLSPSLQMRLPSAHRFHTEAAASGQQPNGLPSASYCCWSGFVFVFDGLTFAHKAQEDSCSPGTDTHSHIHTCAKLKSSALRPRASSPASVRAMMSL